VRSLFISFFIAGLVCGQTAPSPQQTPQSQNSQSQETQPAPAPIHTSITVTGAVSTNTPSPVVVLNQQNLQATPGVNLDDRLRQVPGFSLFRRTSSVVANPTTQGVSLRAIGSTGASRTLVLWDGVPLNDPFGGWVYWTRVSPDFVDRVEVERGGTSSVFGDDAMAGAISLFSPQPENQRLVFSYFGGSEDTQDISGGYSNRWGRFGLTTDLHAFTTDGYYIVPDSIRGRADTRANSEYVTGALFLDFLGSVDRLSVRLDILAEQRHNGTVLQRNSTGLGTVSANYSHSWEKDQISFIGYHTQERFNSSYSAVSADRNSETLSSTQKVPVQNTGGALYWSHHGMLNDKYAWNTVLGADTDDTHGISYDFSLARRTLTESGGTLLEHGLFGQGDIQFGRVRFYGGIRHQFTGEGDTFVSPNGGIAVAAGSFRFRAAGYRSFRAPTLNELYRQFRVGNVLTTANAALRNESLTGVETGVDWVNRNTHVSVTLFHNDLQNLIGNATLSVTPSLILRQRQNMPDASSRGVEVSVDHRWSHWIAQAGYLYADSRMSTGPLLAQVPKQQGSASLTYVRRSTMISAGLRAYGLQFDDDQNQFLLPGFAAIQIAAQQHLTKSLFAQVAVENLLDRQYLVALTPNPNIGAPRLWRIGLRWNGPLP
jgi:outer membrane cobalamin receptor